MSDDLDKKIQQIAEMLGQDKVPDNIKSLVSLFASSLANKDSGEEKPPEDEPPEEEKTVEDGDVPGPDDSEEMMRKVKKVMNGMSESNDPRINLLHAIKPFMSNKRQKKIVNAIQLLKITGVTKLLNNDK